MCFTIIQHIVFILTVLIFPFLLNPDLQIHVYPPSVSEQAEFCAQSAVCSFYSYLDVLLEKDINCNLTTKLNDRRDDFHFYIVNFPCLFSNIPLYLS